jgi:hypothetical protein
VSPDFFEFFIREALSIPLGPVTCVTIRRLLHARKSKM